MLRSIGNIDEHIAISGAPRSTANFKTNPKPFQKNGFDYRPVNYEVNGRNRLNEINVAKGDEQNLVYQYTKHVANKNNHLGGGATDKSALTYKKGDYTTTLPKTEAKVNPIVQSTRSKSKVQDGFTLPETVRPEAETAPSIVQLVGG